MSPSSSPATNSSVDAARLPPEHGRRLVIIGAALAALGLALSGVAWAVDADRFAHAASDTAVDFVEDDRARELRRAGSRLQHEHQPRRFSAGCYSRERSYRFAAEAVKHEKASDRHSVIVFGELVFDSEAANWMTAF